MKREINSSGNKTKRPANVVMVAEEEKEGSDGVLWWWAVLMALFRLGGCVIKAFLLKFPGGRTDEPGGTASYSMRGSITDGKCPDSTGFRLQRGRCP